MTPERLKTEFVKGDQIYREISREGLIALYEVLGQNGIRRSGYQLAIIQQKRVSTGIIEIFPDENQRPKQTWHYDMTELRWANEGFKTLTDAQNRSVLDQRQYWKPPSPHCRNAQASKTPYFPVSAILTLPEQNKAI
jgi:hypothetical protein